MVERGDKIFGETKEENVEAKRDGYEYSIGRSQIIAIYWAEIDFDPILYLHILLLFLFFIFIFLSKISYNIPQ